MASPQRNIALVAYPAVPPDANQLREQEPRWANKRPAEVWPYSVDIATLLDSPADTITNFTLQIAPDTALVADNLSVSGTVISLRLSGGISAVDYSLVFSGQLASGSAFQFTINLYVQPLIDSAGLVSAPLGPLTYWPTGGFLQGRDGISIVTFRNQYILVRAA